MAKTKQVRWNGAKEDPDSIVQHGITFEKGVWTSVPDDSNDAEASNLSLTIGADTVQSIRKGHKPVIHRLRDNPQFEVKGMEADDESETVPQGSASIARAPANTYAVQGVTPQGKRKPTHWVIVNKDGDAIPNGDEYADEASAQVVADGMNKVVPAGP